MSKFINQEIGGFTIVEQIGIGGMARVFKAYQPAFDRFVALKILHNNQGDNEIAIQRFIQEARIIAKLEHTHIVPVFDFGEDNQLGYLAMRYLQAGTLKDLIASAQNQQIPLIDTARIISQMAAALDYAHQQDIVHRDVKPGNILVDVNGDAYLTDFGIAKVLDATTQFTITGGALGTPAYMSPEQGQGKPVDGRTDIYSLGIILYQMLVGKAPYQADTPMATILAHLTEPLPAPSSHNKKISPNLDKVINTALAKDPEKRFNTASQFGNALLAAAGETAPPKASTAFVNLSKGLAKGKPSEDITFDDRQFLQHHSRNLRRQQMRPFALGAVVIATLASIFLLFNQSREITAGIQGAEAEATNVAPMIAAQTATFEATISFVPSSTPTITPTATNTPLPTPTQVPNYDVISPENANRLEEVANFLAIGDVGFTADGNTAVSLFCDADDNCEVRFWALPEWQIERSISINEMIETGFDATAISISNDGILLAIGSDRGEVIVYDLEQEEIIMEGKHISSSGIGNLSFSSDNSMVQGQSQTSAGWLVDTGQLLYAPNGSLRFDYTNNRMAMDARCFECTGQYTIIDVGTLSEINTMTLSYFGPFFLSDNVFGIGNRLQGFVTVYSFDTFQPINTFRGGGSQHIGINPDGNLILLGPTLAETSSNEIKIFDIISAELINTIVPEDSFVDLHGTGFSVDGKWIFIKYANRSTGEERITILGIPQN